MTGLLIVGNSKNRDTEIVARTVKNEYETKEVYPAPDDIFNAFAFASRQSKSRDPGTGPVP